MVTLHANIHIEPPAHIHRVFLFQVFERVVLIEGAYVSLRLCLFCISSSHEVQFTDRELKSCTPSLHLYVKVKPMLRVELPNKGHTKVLQHFSIRTKLSIRDGKVRMFDPASLWWPVQRHVSLRDLIAFSAGVKHFQSFVIYSNNNVLIWTSRYYFVRYSAPSRMWSMPN